MDNPLISVIVPIYKVEPYIRRCLDSIVNQTYTNLEIILVDDGSPDGCPAICDEYAAKDNRIVVIHKENGGLSDARNAGLDICKGEYISFVDSDDWITDIFFDILISSAIINSCDIAICNYISTPCSFSQKMICKDIKEKIYLSESSVLQLWEPHGAAFITAWGKIFKSYLWKETRFPQGKIHEDEYTIFKLLFSSPKTVFIDIPLYNYYQRANSITGTEYNRQLQTLKANEERYKFFKEKGADKILAKCVFDLNQKSLAAYVNYNQIKKYIHNDYPHRIQLFKLFKSTTKDCKRLFSNQRMIKITLTLITLFPKIYLLYKRKLF